MGVSATGVGRSSCRLVILDRDGVINEDSGSYIKSPDEWHPIAGSLEAVATLNQAGYQVVVATNQSGVGRGLFTEETLNAIHARMTAALESKGAKLSGIYYCPHRPEDRCLCRKPAPGLLLAIARDLHCALAGVPLVGDKLSDVLAAEAVGAVPLFVRADGGRLAERPQLPVYGDLAGAVQAILSQDKAS